MTVFLAGVILMGLVWSPDILAYVVADHPKESGFLVTAMLFMVLIFLMLLRFG